MIWYKWLSEEDFNNWHEKVIKGLSLPKYGVNQKTGEIDENTQQTTSYTELVFVYKNDYRAMVEEHIANQYNKGLGVLSETPPFNIEL